MENNYKILKRVKQKIPYNQRILTKKSSIPEKFNFFGDFSLKTQLFSNTFKIFG